MLHHSKIYILTVANAKLYCNICKRVNILKTVERLIGLYSPRKQSPMLKGVLKNASVSCHVTLP